MLNTNDYSTKLLGLQGVLIEKVEETPNFLKISLVAERKPHPCPSCGNDTARVHDYRKQTVVDLDLRGTSVLLCLRKRRYVYTECGKRFFENISILLGFLQILQKSKLFVKKKQKGIDKAGVCGYNILNIAKI